MKLNIKKHEIIIILSVLVVLLTVGIIMLINGARNLSSAMDKEFLLQTSNNMRYDPSTYMSQENMHGILWARNTLLIGAALTGISFVPLGIYFTCKWIRSLIPQK